MSKSDHSSDSGKDYLPHQNEGMVIILLAVLAVAAARPEAPLHGGYHASSAHRSNGFHSARAVALVNGNGANGQNGANGEEGGEELSDDLAVPSNGAPAPVGLERRIISSIHLNELENKLNIVVGRYSYFLQAIGLVGSLTSRRIRPRQRWLLDVKEDLKTMKVAIWMQKTRIDRRHSTEEVKVHTKLSLLHNCQLR
ncbi:hypothetical protein J437_LFUL006320, partial [Ladona fulva]